MHVAVYCPLLASAVLGRSAPWLARRLPPRTASRLLGPGGVLVAAASVTAQALLAFTLLAQLPLVAAWGRWSPQALQATSPVPRLVAAAAVAGLVVTLVRAGRLAVGHGAALSAARRLCRDVGGRPGQLVVVEADIAAVALPVAGGRVLASRRHLAALPADERRALLLHERAHLDQRHHLHRLGADLAAAVDPLQTRVPGAVRYATERWADETAASVLGDRTVVARSLARSGLLAAGPDGARWQGVALHSGGSRVVQRVEALLAPAPRQRPVLLAATLLVVVAGLSTAAHAQADTEAVVQHAAPAVVAAVPADR